MATNVTSPHRTGPAGYLLFPWTLTSIVIILVLNIFLKDWFGRNATWISLVLVVPAAIIENIKLGYSSMRVMYLKIFYSLISFLLCVSSCCTFLCIGSLEGSTGSCAFSLRINVSARLNRFLISFIIGANSS